VIYERLEGYCDIEHTLRSWLLLIAGLQFNTERCAAKFKDQVSCDGDNPAEAEVQ
jgi:hypothetical protein